MKKSTFKYLLSKPAKQGEPGGYQRPPSDKKLAIIMAQLRGEQVVIGEGYGMDRYKK